AAIEGLVDRGLRATAALWPAIVLVFGGAHRAARILGAQGAGAALVRRRLGGLFGAMARDRQRAGAVADAVRHFLEVGRRYCSGLFAWYEAADVPRTNNGLEQLFGSHRYHERRAVGRKAASPALVLRGSVRMVASVATRQRALTAADLAGADRAAWARLRRQLDERRQRRTGRRLWRDPGA